MPRQTKNPSARSPAASPSPPPRRPSTLLDTRIIYCGDCLDQLRKLREQVIVALTVREILDEEIAKKLA